MRGKTGKKADQKCSTWNIWNWEGTAEQPLLMTVTKDNPAKPSRKVLRNRCISRAYHVTIQAKRRRPQRSWSRDGPKMASQTQVQREGALPHAPFFTKKVKAALHVHWMRRSFIYRLFSASISIRIAQDVYIQGLWIYKCAMGENRQKGILSHSAVLKSDCGSFHDCFYFGQRAWQSFRRTLHSCFQEKIEKWMKNMNNEYITNF